MNYSMNDDIANVLVSQEELAEITQRIGKQISEDFRDSKKLVLLCILKGSTPFFADLMRAITVPCEIEFMRVSSYFGTESTGKLNILLDMNRDDMEECDIVCPLPIGAIKSISRVEKSLLTFSRINLSEGYTGVSSSNALRFIDTSTLSPLTV